MQSLIDYFEELGLSFAVVTESWLYDGKALQDAVDDLEGGVGIGILTRNRARKGRKVAGGGVAVAFDKKRLNLKMIPTRMDGCEIITASGKLRGISRKLVIIAAYIPPKQGPLVGTNSSTPCPGLLAKSWMI